jgi:hypothetical protein
LAEWRSSTGRDGRSEPFLDVRGELQIACDRNDECAPDLPGHDDRRRDQRRHAECDQPFVELRRHFGVVGGHPRGRASRRGLRIRAEEASDFLGHDVEDLSVAGSVATVTARRRARPDARS